MISVEPNGLVAIIGVIILAIASLFGLVLFVNREETFEDVVAAQKKEQEALLSSLQSSKSGKSNKKWSKLKSKKATKKDEHDADSGVDDEEPSLESIATPSAKVGDDTTETTNGTQLTNRKSKKSKPVVDPPAEKAVDEPKQTSTKEKKKKQKPKEIVEEVTEHVTEEVVESSLPHPVADVEVCTKEEKSNEEAVPKTDIRKKSQPKTKAPKEKSVEKPKAEDVVTTRKLMKDIENLHLTPSEVQDVVDALLAKQSEIGQWKKPNQKADPMEQLKRQLQESETKYNEEHNIAQSSALKLKDLRHELQQQRHAFQNQAKEKMTQQAKEHEHLRKKLEENHMSEMQSTQIQIQRMQELIDGASQNEFHRMKEEINRLQNASLRAQQLSDDNKSLMNELSQVQQKNKQLRTDLDKSIMQTKQTEQQQKSMKDQIAIYENEIQNTQRSKNDTEQILSQRFQEVNSQLLKFQDENRNLLAELEQARKCHQTVTVEKETLQNTSSTNTTEVVKLQTKLKDAENKLLASKDIQTKLTETEAKLTQAQIYKDKLASVESKLCDADNLQAKLNDSVNKLAESNKKLADLNTSNETLRKTVATLQAELERKGQEFEGQQQQQQQQQQSGVNECNKNELKKCQDELQAVHDNVHSLITSVDSEPASDDVVMQLNNKINELQTELLQLKSGMVPSSSDTSKELQQLKDAMKVVQEESSAKDNVLASMKSKNNELREKNWKAMDALGKSESETEKKIKSLERSIFQGLKKLHPEINLQYDGDMEAMFSKYEKSLCEKNDDGGKMKDANQQLIQELEDLKQSTSANLDKNAAENEHLRTVLAETESMLSRLQDNVDAEVCKWQKKVEEKERDLVQSMARVQELEKAQADSSHISQLEHQLKASSNELEQEKLKVDNLKADLGETKAKLEASSKVESKDSKAEIDDLNSKLKKTISERDLLIREFKSLKEKSAKMEKNSQKQEAEMKKVQNEIDALKASSAASGNKEKDKLIGKLYVEIQDLKEDLKDSRDQVVVDIESADAEDLHKQVDSLAGELQSAKQSKLELSMKLEDLEKSFHEEQSDKDKLLNVESKLMAAEARIRELEQGVESQIADAMKQAGAGGNTV